MSIEGLFEVDDTPSAKKRLRTPLDEEDGEEESSSSSSSQGANDSDVEGDGEDHDSWGDRSWEIGEILGKRTLKLRGRSKVEYMVTWKGTDKNGDPWAPSWEPLENLMGSAEAIATFEKKRRKANTRKVFAKAEESNKEVAKVAHKGKDEEEEEDD